MGAVLEQREILQDWTRVIDFDVGDTEVRSFEYHVEEDTEKERVTLKIKCLAAWEKNIRLDPIALAHYNERRSFSKIAEYRVKQLYARGLI